MVYKLLLTIGSKTKIENSDEIYIIRKIFWVDQVEYAVITDNYNKVFIIEFKNLKGV